MHLQQDTPRHGAPASDNLQPHASAENTAELSGLQDAAAPVQEPAASLSLAKRYEVSVDEIRARLIGVDISKSKDTIQRYCREGRLDCQKIGVFRRYYATEESVKKLIAWLQIDADADGGKQVHEDASTDMRDEMQPHASAPSDITNEIQEPHAGASSRPQMDADASTVVQMLKQQIADKDEDITFLREELRERRSAVNALEKLVDAFGKNAETARLTAANEERRMKEVLRVRDDAPADEFRRDDDVQDQVASEETVENDDDARYRV